jgi:hypothetical protein
MPAATAADDANHAAREAEPEDEPDGFPLCEEEGVLVVALV